ncbi:MAG: hypothetical protein WBW48_02060 [Anaerolineae bacterium]
MFIYFSGETMEYARKQIERITFEFREIFTFNSGPNRIDEPKYRLPLTSKMPFIFTVDDDIIFEDDILTILMDTYNDIQTLYPQNGHLSPVGWFGTVIENGQLMTPMEGRYNLVPGQIQQVDYLGSCGCLYRREILDDARLRYENWPSFIGSASDFWLSYLIIRYYHTPMFITGLHKKDLPEHGHSLWEDSISRELPGIVERLVSYGWKS